MLADGEASIRFRTCTLHRREDEVDMNGVPSRYCQQCTRFHPLSEFDGLKHGCRKRLDRHNLRRKRKNASKREVCTTMVPRRGCLEAVLASQHTIRVAEKMCWLSLAQHYDQLALP